MNATEKILAERMAFVTRRGRTAEYQRNEWLKKMRAERNRTAEPYDVQIGIFHRSATTFRQAKIIAIGTLCELNKGKRTGRYDGVIKDKITQIQLWESWN